MELSDDMCKNLIKWLQTLDLNTTAQTLEELSDGVVIAQALVQIAPDYFIRLNSSIHTDIGTNWRLKVNNLRKIIKCLDEYYQDVLNLHLLDTAKPDLSKIGEHSDHKEIGKMLRLVLGCAVNCDAKQEYITRIMALEESVQQNIMQAIQQLEEVTHGRGRSSLSLLGMESDTKFQRLLAELEAATEVKDLLSQKCHNLETQIVCLTEEKSTLSVENGRLIKKLKEVESYSRDEPEGIMRNTEMRRQIESLKDDLFKIETQRDDYRLKVLEQEKEIQLLQEKNIELQSAAEKAAQLKDEIDALTETAEKAKTLEMTVSSYKKKLEEYTDLKRKYKTLKDENNEYYQQNIQYQEEIKRNNLYKSQSELYKKQVVDLHQKIEEENRKCDKFSFENKKLQSKLLMVQREKESLIEERDGLKEMNEELHCQQQRQKSEEPTAVASELAPTELQARVKYLERENASLRSSSEEAVAKQLFFEDVQNRLEKALEQNRNYNHRILELEAQVEDVTKGISGCSSGSSAEQQQQAMDELAIYRNKCVSLQNSLANKENELQTTVARYKKSLEKARDVIKQLEPDDKSVKPQQQRSTEEDQFMSKRLAAMREQEEKLLTSSFYKLTMVCQREAVDERFALLTHGQSFLSRQRQSAPRKPIQPFRSK